MEAWAELASPRVYAVKIGEMHQRQKSNEAADDDDRRGRDQPGFEPLARAALKPRHLDDRGDADEEHPEGDPEVQGM